MQYQGVFSKAASIDSDDFPATSHHLKIANYEGKDQKVFFVLLQRVRLSPSFLRKVPSRLGETSTMKSSLLQPSLLLFSSRLSFINFINLILHPSPNIHSFPECFPHSLISQSECSSFFSSSPPAMPCFFQPSSSTSPRLCAKPSSSRISRSPLHFQFCLSDWSI